MKKEKLLIFMLPLLLTGCANGSNNNDKPQEKEDCYIKEDVTIDFLCMSNRNYYSLLHSIVDDFSKIEPHVKVNLKNPLGAGDYSMIEKTVISGFFNEDYPDIVQCFPDHVVKYNAYNYVVKLDDYLNNEEYGLKEEKDDYIEEFLTEGSNYAFEGTYSLPFCKSTELLYYNADVLLGLDLSTINLSINNGQPLDEKYLNYLTWEELFDVLCPALESYNNSLDEEHKIYKNTSNTGIVSYDSDENFFITLAHQYGYGYTSLDENGKGSIDFNNEGMKTLLKKFNTMKNKHYLQTGKTFDDYVSILFLNKESLFTISSTAGLSYNFDFKNPFALGVGQIPRPEGKNNTLINQGPSICILDHKDENRKLASYLFWKHLTNEKNATSWAVQTGYMGIRNSSYTSEEYQKALSIDENASLYDKAVADNLKMISEVSDSLFSTPPFRGSANARTSVGNLIKDCLLSTDIDNEIDELFLAYELEAKSYVK